MRDGVESEIRALLETVWGAGVGGGGCAVGRRLRRWHREVVYAFPASGLLGRTAQKAIADAAPCVLVVPVAMTASHWHKLMACSVLERKPTVDGVVRVRNPRRELAPAVAEGVEDAGARPWRGWCSVATGPECRQSWRRSTCT